MRVILWVGATLVVLSALACSGEDGGSDEGSSGATSTAGASGGAGSSSGSSGTSGAGGVADGALMRMGVAVQFDNTPCAPGDFWAVPNADDPATATSEGELLVHQGWFSNASSKCLVQPPTEAGGEWWLVGIARIGLPNDYEKHIGLDVWSDGTTPAEGGIQIIWDGVAWQISSNQAGPCLYTFTELTAGNARGKVECAATTDANLNQCGTAVVYFTLRDCYTTGTDYNAGV